MSFDSRKFRTLDRRALIAASVTGGIGLISARALATQDSTPGSFATSSPGASPVASHAATPILFRNASPVADFPLDVIRDQRPLETTSPVTGGELRLFIQGSGLEDFSPVSFRQDFQVACSIYDPLVWLDEVTCEPKPCLAESWSWSPDGLTLTFTIRSDVSWHDGTSLTASDVAFSLIAYQQDYSSAVSGFFSLVSDIKSTDDQTVKISFSEVDGSFLFNAGNLLIFQSNQYGFAWSSRPLGERSLDGYDWNRNPPIGTGPWQYDSASPTQVVFRRNETYWAGPANADRLLLTVEDDPAKRLDSWKRNEVDVIWPIPPLQTADLLQEPGRLYAADTLRTLFAAYNFDNWARVNPYMFASVELRQALLLAVNRDAYQQSLFGSFIDTAKAGSINQPWARDERIVNPARNIDMANRLLDSIGWFDNDGDGLRETPEGDILQLVAIVESDAQPELIQILQSLDRDFGDIGVALTVDILEPDAWTERWVTTHDFDLIAYSLLEYGAFNEFDLYGSAWDIRTNNAGWNPGAYSNETVDSALAEWFAAYRIEDMQVALYKLQRAVTDDPFGLYFGFPQDPVLVRPEVYGFQPNKIWQSWNTRNMWTTRQS
jgi:peptide/nickel transport system substrate-binding protein